MTLFAIHRLRDTDLSAETTHLSYPILNRSSYRISKFHHATTRKMFTKMSRERISQDNRQKDKKLKRKKKYRTFEQSEVQARSFGRLRLEFQNKCQ